MKRLAIDVALALALVVVWGVGVTVLTMWAGLAFHPAAGVVVALGLIYATALSIAVHS